MIITSNPSSLLDLLEQMSAHDTDTLEQAMYAIRQELRNRPDADYISIVWCTEDIQWRRPDLTVEQCREVLKALDDSHNAEYGITWDHIDWIAGGCYPAPDNLDELRDEVYPDGLP